MYHRCKRQESSYEIYLQQGQIGPLVSSALVVKYGLLAGVELREGEDRIRFRGFQKACSGVGLALLRRGPGMLPNTYLL